MRRWKEQLLGSVDLASVGGNYFLRLFSFHFCFNSEPYSTYSFDLLWTMTLLAEVIFPLVSVVRPVTPICYNFPREKSPLH